MKHFLVASFSYILSFFLFASNAFADADTQIVFFGDSLSDNGNLYRITSKVVPKSPPYFDGRFTNGLVWAEHVALNYSYKYQIYAVGGATAVLHMPTTRFVAPTTLTLEIYKYLIDTFYTDRSHNLFVIWVGDNDYMFYQDLDAAENTTNVVNSIISGIVTLSEYGAKNFLVLNLTDTSRTPYIQTNGSVATMHNLVAEHNRKLDAAIKQFKASRPDIKLGFLDVNAFFDDIIENTQKYNEVYRINITDTKSACWDGGIIFRNLNEPQNLYTANSPELNYTYLLGKSFESGNMPCTNPNEHIFWDSMHPTAIFHQVLGKIAIDMIEKEQLL